MKIHSYYTESKQLEMKIERVRKEMTALFIVCLIIWASCIVGVCIVAHHINLTGKI
jgi:hypothetical protein